MNIPESHFRLLRLAIYHQLSEEQTGPNVFLIGSRSQPKHRHTVNPVEESCCCPAFGWCSHLALALDRWMSRTAPAHVASEYFAARRLDFGGLLGRDDLKADDKRFVRVVTEKARETYGHLFIPTNREAVSF